ncbi:MAG: YkgJ family cysteine cluster protein, partial [Anaerolineae bacterium]
LADMEDKYTENETVMIDCASRIPLCHGRCCTFKFYLSKQDLEEGFAKWDYGNPYWIRQGEEGFCVHSDPCTRLCTIHEKRPHICRKYSCRDDKRIWEDFEKRIPAPAAEPSQVSPIAMAEMSLKKVVRKAQEEADVEEGQHTDEQPG